MKTLSKTWVLLGFIGTALCAVQSQGGVSPTCQNNKYERLLKTCGGLTKKFEENGLVRCMKRIMPKFRNLSESCQDEYYPKTIIAMEPVLKTYAQKIEFDAGSRRLNEASLNTYFSAWNLWLDLIHGYDARFVKERLAAIGETYWTKVNSFYVDNGVADRPTIFANNTLALKAAFDTVNETPLLSMYLVVQMFDQMEEQIATIAATEDYYCQIDNCELSKNPERFYTYRLAQSWRNFADSPAYEIDSASKQILTLLRDNQTKVFRFVDRWFFDTLENQMLFDFPYVQRRFLGIFKTFSHLIRNKSNDGYFTGSNSSELRSGFDTAFRDRVLSRLKEQNTELERDLGKYDRLKSDHLQLLLQKQREKQSILEMDQNWKVLTQEYQNIKSDIRGLELSNLKKTQAFAQYNRTIQDNADLFKQYFKTEAIATGRDSWTVSARDAKFTGSMPTSDFTSVAFRKIAGSAGQILNVNITGQYSPKCSLAKSPYFDGQQMPGGITFGPEGFVVKLTKGQTSVESVTKGSTESSHSGWESNRPSCPSHRKKGCGGYVEGNRNTQYTNNTASDSKHSDMSAHFSMGLKLPLTPFYDFPAGSLLAVIMPTGERNLHKARDIRVMGGANQLVLGDDADVYFVVNDCINSNPNTANALNVEISKTMGLEQGKQMVEQFVAALGKARKEGDAIVAAGANVGPEVNLLIKKVIAEFAMADADNSFYKVPKLRDLFDYWLHNEGNKILNRAKIKELDRRISVLAYKLNAHEGMKAATGTRRHLNQLRFQNLLANIDSNLIQAKLSDVLRFGSGVTLPMVKFHYPEVLTRVSNTIPAPQITILDSFKVIGEYVSAMTNQVASTFSDEDAISRKKGQYRSMVLYFPRPASVFPGQVFFGSGLADVNRSYALWDAFMGTSNEANLSFHEHDFYRLDGAPGFLNCDIVNPIVMDTMLGFVFKKDRVTTEEIQLMNDYGIVSGIEFSPMQRFATRSGLKDFRLKDASVGTSSIAYGFATENNIRHLANVMDAKNHTKDTGLGLSPISDIKLKDIKTIKKVFKSSCERCKEENLAGMAIAFKVYFKHTHVDLNWPKACIDPGLNDVFKKTYLDPESVDDHPSRAY